VDLPACYALSEPTELAVPDGLRDKGVTQSVQWPCLDPDCPLAIGGKPVMSGRLVTFISASGRAHALWRGSRSVAYLRLLPDGPVTAPQPAVWTHGAMICNDPACPDYGLSVHEVVISPPAP